MTSTVFLIILFPFSYLMQNALGYHGDRGLLSSLVGWIAGNATPSFIEGQSLSVEVRVPKAPTLCTVHHSSKVLSPLERQVLFVILQVWFAWLVLNMEGVFEEDSQLRRCVEHELLSEPNISPEQALKVCTKVYCVHKVVQ